MLYWIILLVFGVPLVAFIFQSLAKDKAREARLDEIKKRLHQKETEKVNAKWDRIKNKKGKE